MTATEELLLTVKISYKSSVIHFLHHNDGITEPGVIMTEDELDEYAEDFISKCLPHGITDEFTKRLMEMSINIKHEKQS